jgi:type II secretion system protein I
MCRWIGSRVGSPFTKTRLHSGESGFTLLEVLVAFAVLAVIIVPILQVFGGGLGTAETARGYSTAALLARSKLAEVGLGEPLAEGDTTGDFDVPGYHWRQTIVRDTSEVAPPEADEVDEPTDPRESVADASGKRKQRRESRAFSEQQSGRFGNRGFGQRQDGFGERQGSFGQRQSERGEGRRSRGQGQSAFGEGRRSGLGQGQSAFGEGRSGMGQGRGSTRSGSTTSSGGRFGRSQGSASSTAGGLGGGEADAGQQTDDLIPYEVTVTVDWNTLRGSGTLTLSTLRLARQQDNTGAGVQ